MARDITTGFMNEADSPIMSPRFFFKAEFDSGTLRFWTGYGDIDLFGETYIGSGDLIKMTNISETQELTARGVVIELAGIDNGIIAILLNEITRGRRVTSYFAFVDDSGAIIADPYQAFGGKIDEVKFRDDGEKAGISLFCESDLIKTSKAIESRYTDEDQKARYPNDTGYSYVSLIQDTELSWGV